MLKVVLESPKRFKAQFIDGKIAPKESQALNFGSAIHLALLEPQTFLKRYAVEPDVRRNTNIYKDWRAEVLKQQPDAVIVSKEEMDDLHGMIESIMAHKDASSMLRRGIPERSIYQTIVIDGVEVRVKVRPDWLHENGDVIDLKTTRDAGFRAFRRQLFELQYHLSAAFHFRIAELEFGKKAERCFWWIALEKACPWDVCVYRANDLVMERGDQDWQRALGRYVSCMQSGVWPGKQDAAQDIDLPGYALYE